MMARKSLIFAALVVALACAHAGEGPKITHKVRPSQRWHTSTTCENRVPFFFSRTVGREPSTPGEPSQRAFNARRAFHRSTTFPLEKHTPRPQSCRTWDSNPRLSLPDAELRAALPDADPFNYA